MVEIKFSMEVADAARAATRFEQMGRLPAGYRRMSFVMDLCAADGCNGNAPIDWDAFLAADDGDFAREAAGIFRHLDRVTGRIDDHFTRRFARLKSPTTPDDQWTPPTLIIT